ncbi:MAG: hypothetical protein JWN66_1567 [Sphingomonas bacterium]|uniref:hypothetical protein n=1 Tax=Sphingomonas bacterium TaxID=1895847 RepID=UPI00262F4D0B|nr:hypothetical protein [Sphingomonas bacterium]MDB5704451.1 hypothetical protein [Sphingomonas bacterium]
MAQYIRMAEPLSIREKIPAAAALAENNLAIDRQAYERLVARRDDVNDKIRFGVIALNSGSLLALLSALGGSGQAAKWLGFDQLTAQFSASAFVTGLIASMAAVIVQQNHSNIEAGDALARTMAAARLLGLYESRDENAHLAWQKALDDYSTAPLVNFRYSKLAIALQNAGQGAWLAGILLPLARALGIPVHF